MTGAHLPDPVGRHFARVATWASRNALIVVTVAVVVTVIAAIGATQLEIDSGTDTLVQPGGEAYTATEEVRQSFGEDPVVILVEGDLRQSLSPPNILRILNLEACLAGNVPEEAKPLPGPCRELAELRPAKLVSGPATFLNQAAAGISGELGRRLSSMQRQAERAARKTSRRALAQGEHAEAAAAAGAAARSRVSRRFMRQALGLASKYGLTGLPNLGDPGFVQAVVFDREKAPGTPKARLSYLFPGPNAAQIVVRLRPDLSEGERARALQLIAEAAAETRPRARCAVPKGGDPQPCFALEGGRYVVSGAPVVLDALADELRHALIVLLGAAVLLMAMALPLVLRSRAPLLPGAVALGATATTFGAYALVGGRLTIAAIAVLPILIGLAVDYAVQMQSRFDEALDGDHKARQADSRLVDTDEPAGLDPAGSAALAAAGAARAGAPTLAAACLATAAGFAILTFSPTPMVRGFGLILAVGVLVSFAYALIVGSATLTLRQRFIARRTEGKRGTETTRGATGEQSLRAAAATLPGALGAIARDWHDRSARRVGALAAEILRLAAVAPGRILTIAVLLALLGWAVGTRTQTVSELPELMPPDLEQVRDLQRLQDATGVSGELDVLVTAPDLTDPEVIAWMASFKRRVLERGGYGGENPSCAEADICPGPSLTDFITDAEQGVSRRRVRELVAALPQHELQAMVEINEESGRLGSAANMAFMIRLMPLQDQHRLIERIRDQVEEQGGPPAGTEVRVGGLPVIAAETASELTAGRYWLTLAALAAVFVALIALLRSLGRVLVVITPIVLATGWSSLMLALIGVPLNPVSAVLGVMVVAISTEFSVILSLRFRQERERGADTLEALRRTYATSGAAVFASGATVILGFAALLASDIRMLRDFGLVTVVDLSVALAGVMLLLPALLILAERRRGPIRVAQGEA